jgi:hypothetical protein
MATNDRPIPPGLVAEAAKHPGGWVYEIAPGYDPAGRVPPEAIVGAWKVDDAGRLTGEYTPNPNHRPQS